MRYFSSEAVSHYPQKTAEMEIDLNRNSNLTLARYADNPQVWIKNTRLISIVFRVCTIQFSSLLNLVNKMIKKINFYFDVSNSKEFYDNSGFTEVAYDSLTIWCKTDNQPLNLQLKPTKIH